MTDITFTCPNCKQSLEAPEDMQGEVIDCPACKTSISIPRINEPEPDAEETEAEIPTDGDIEDSSESKQVLSETCRRCGSPMAADAVVCVQCGFDKRTGKDISTSRIPNAKHEDMETVMSRMDKDSSLFWINGRLHPMVFLYRAVPLCGIIYGLIKASKSFGYKWDEDVMTPIRQPVKIVVAICLWCFICQLVQFIRGLIFLQKNGSSRFKE